jgi:uncharacterized protein (DUF305 family)
VKLVAVIGATLALVLSSTRSSAQPQPPTGDPTANPGDSFFLSESRESMANMVRAMDISPTGDVDADFVAMMVPHHQAAIEMALSELRHGHNEQLRRIAEEIIVSQLEEVARMQSASPPYPSNMQPVPDMGP